jgi:hypothetical protein
MILSRVSSLLGDPIITQLESRDSSVIHHGKDELIISMKRLIGSERMRIALSGIRVEGRSAGVWEHFDLLLSFFCILCLKAFWFEDMECGSALQSILAIECEGVSRRTPIFLILTIDLLFLSLLLTFQFSKFKR